MPLCFALRRAAGEFVVPQTRIRCTALAALAAAAAVALLPSVAAAAPVVGSEQIQSYVDSSAAGSARAFRYTAPASGKVDQLNVYVDSASVPSTITVGLYTNAKDRPATRVTSCAVSAPKAGWNTCSAPTASVTTDTRYWLAVLAPAGSGRVAFRDRPRDGSVSFTSASSSLTALPATFAVGSRRNGYSPASIYGATAADTTPTPTPSPSPSPTPTPTPTPAPGVPDCSADVTSELAAKIAATPDGGTLTLQAGGCYRIEGTLELRQRTMTVDGNGATLRSFGPPDDQRAMWRVWNSKVTWRSMNLVGSYANGGTLDESLQHAHAIDLRGTDALIENVTMSDLAGDCVYFGLGADRSTGTVRDSTCVRTSRNAVSVTAGDDVLVQRMTTGRIGFITFDVEPNPGAGFGSCRAKFDGNTIGSYRLYAWAIAFGHAPTCDQTFSNNRVVGQGLRLAVITPTYRPQRVTITGNSSDTAQSPAAMDFTGIDGLTVTGNTVPLSGGGMARVCDSTAVLVSGNATPGGTQLAGC